MIKGVIAFVGIVVGLVLVTWLLAASVAIKTAKAGEERYPDGAAKQVSDIDEAVKTLQREAKRLRARVEALEALPTAAKEIDARDTIAAMER